MSQESQLTAPTSPKHQIAAELGEGLNSSSLELPVMPRVANKVLALTHDPNAEVSDLSELIHSDQSIASHVLRIANSAAYGGGDQIVSLQQAVARLGMNLLGEIAIAVSVQNDLFKAPGFERSNHSTSTSCSDFSGLREGNFQKTPSQCGEPILVRASPFCG